MKSLFRLNAMLHVTAGKENVEKLSFEIKSSKRSDFIKAADFPVFI